MVAFGVSEGGTENSVLRVLAVDVGIRATLADEIPNCRACSVGVGAGRVGLLLHPLSGGRRVQPHGAPPRLGDDPADDPVVWAEHSTPETWPNVDVSPDGRWVLVDAMVGWSRTDLHVLDRLAPEVVAAI